MSDIILSHRAASFGATLEVEDIDTSDRAVYQLVGPFEADATNGQISIDSPMGRTLLGRRVGDEVMVYAPGGVRAYRITFIFFHLNLIKESRNTPVHLAPQKSLLPLETMSQFAEPVIPDKSA